MTLSLEALSEELLGRAPSHIYDLVGGCVGDVKRLRFADDQTVVVKLDENRTGGLEVEGQMLTYLREHSELPVPEVIASRPEILVMTDLGGSTGARGRAQEEAAQALAQLHTHTAEFYGLDFDTRIGGLVQVNTQSESWGEFFRDHRLLDMSRQAAEAGKLPEELHTRLRNFAEGVVDELADCRKPALIHGDVWAGNVLAKPKKLHGFIDPAIYYADPEIELAFINLFGTFSQKFFSIYSEVHEIHEDFRERRQHVYNLYPLLVHVRLFGGGYVGQLDQHLARLEG